MTVVPGAAPQTLSLVCDTCGQAVDGIESSVDHWPFEPKPVRPHCETCDRPADFCECEKEEG